LADAQGRESQGEIGRGMKRSINQILDADDLDLTMTYEQVDYLNDMRTALREARAVLSTFYDDEEVAALLKKWDTP